MARPSRFSRAVRLWEAIQVEPTDGRRFTTLGVSLAGALVLRPTI
jgi:hypothetical protein